MDYIIKHQKNTNDIKFTIFSSISCRPTAKTFSIAAGSEKVTKPNPLKQFFVKASIVYLRVSVAA